MEGILSTWTTQATQWVQSFIMGFAESLPKIGNSLLDILLGLVVAFYFLMEKEKILDFCHNTSMLFCGKKNTNRLRRFFHEVDTVLMGYLGGQLTDAAIMAVRFSMVFVVVGFH